jgi:hypothetical protein
VAPAERVWAVDPDAQNEGKKRSLTGHENTPQQIIVEIGRFSIVETKMPVRIVGGAGAVALQRLPFRIYIIAVWL